MVKSAHCERFRSVHLDGLANTAQFKRGNSVIAWHPSSQKEAASYGVRHQACEDFRRLQSIYWSRPRMLPIRTILHPTDFSECSRHAGELAASLAKKTTGARLTLLHVVEPLIRSPEVSMPLDPLALRTTAEQEFAN